MRLPLLICAAMLVGFAVQTWTLPHYFSPATGALYILLVQGMRQLWHWSCRAPPDRTGPGSRDSGAGLRYDSAARHSGGCSYPDRTRVASRQFGKGEILHQLEHCPGLNLVIVRYGPHPDPTLDWVYNEANIDAAKVVWARDMGKNGNQELLQLFLADRRVWQSECRHFAPSDAGTV